MRNIREILAQARGVYSDVDLVGLHDRAIALPAQWRELLATAPDQWRDRVVNWWAPFGHRLPRFIRLFEASLRDVVVARHKERVLLLYWLEAGGQYWLYEGGPPHTESVGTATDRLFVEAAPKDLIQFYQELHDGFVFAPAQTLGPLARRSMFRLAEQEWGWLEGVEDRSVYGNLDETVAVFSNGGGGYLCLDPSSRETGAGVVWWSDEPPDRADFWGALDAWMEIGLAE